MTPASNQSTPFGLVGILVRCRELVEASEDSIYSSLSCKDILAALDRGIASVANEISDG